MELYITLTTIQHALLLLDPNSLNLVQQHGTVHVLP